MVPQTGYLLCLSPMSNHNQVVVLFVTVFVAFMLCATTTTELSIHHITTPLLTTFLVSIPTVFVHQRIRYALQFLIGELMIFLCMADCFCQDYFATPVTPQVLSNILLSDSRETGEFISTFIGFHVLSHWRIDALLLLSVVFPLVLFFQKNSACQIKTNKYVIGGILFFCVAIETPATYRFVQLFLQRDDLQKIEGLIFRHYHEEVPTPLHRFIFAEYALRQSSHFLNDMKQATFSAQPDSCSVLSPHIILVIGESYNKQHSALYGYSLPTTPLQEIRKNNGELFVFSNVISPWNITSNAFLEMFSVWEYGMDVSKGKYPLFPILFRRAGYDVNFFSNQYQLHGFRKGATNQAGHFFLADVEMSDSLFSFRNRKSEKYDEWLVRQVKEYKQEHNTSEHTLDIIHLIGQHFEYSERYPKQKQFFTIKDYSGRELSHNEKKIVMHYDNATRYNDAVLDSIITVYEKENAIMLFVADHGEEVYDELPVYGRLFQEPTATQARNEFEIPMWIWCSDSYLQGHPDIISNIRQAQNKPFMTDGISQILFSLAGISCQWRDDTRNLLSPKYRSKQRIIGGIVDYDKEVCQK